MGLYCSVHSPVPYRLQRTASTVPEVQSIFTIAGDPDALVRVRVRDVAHLQEVIDTLRTAGTVTGTKTLLVLGAWNRGAS